MNDLTSIAGHVTAFAVAVSLGCPAVAIAAPISGRVLTADTNRGIAQAAVTLIVPDAAAGTMAITTFTSADGVYRFPDGTLPAGPRIGEAPLSIRARKLGYEQVQAGANSVQRADSTNAELPVDLYLEPAADIARQAPASAWLADAPAGDARNITLTSCSSCHQVASPRMREYAALIEAVSGGPQRDEKALAAWRKVVRHEAWRAVVKYMRAMHYSVFPLESATSLDNVDWPTAQNADLSFFNERQGEITAQYLAANFPTSTSRLPTTRYDYGAPLGVTQRTVIREFAFPERALVRELVPAPDTSFLWGADVKRNLIVRLDPATGATRWYPVEFEGSTGPHTIVPDDAGNLWVSMVDNDQFGRFDPRTEQWTLWTLRPSNLPDADSLAGAAIVHDMSIDSRGHLARDLTGRIWLTIVGTNQMGTLHPDTGAVAFYDTNAIDGFSPINHLLYAAVLSADGRRVWYSQVNGWVGAIDTVTNEVVTLIPFREGTGPRRMARDNDGHLWVALFGSGEVAKIDMAAGALRATYPLPDRAAAPYSVTWDEHRKCLWVVNANSDVIYRLHPASGKITVYPMPRSMAYLRQLAVDQRTGQLVGTYGNYPEGSGPSMGVLIDVGD